MMSSINPQAVRRVAEPLRTAEALGDLELAERIGHRERAAVEVMMRRYNARLFRVARSILKDDAEAEEAL